MVPHAEITISSVCLFLDRHGGSRKYLFLAVLQEAAGGEFHSEGTYLKLFKAAMVIAAFSIFYFCVQISFSLSSMHTDLAILSFQSGFSCLLSA